MSVTWSGFPTLTLEIGFASTTGGFGVWGSSEWGTALWGPSTTWTDITGYVYSIYTTRGRSRETESYPVGTMTVELRNGDARFSAANLAGPYVVGGVSQIIPRRPVRLRATWNSVTYDLFYGFVDSWADRLPGQGTEHLAEFSAFDSLSLLGAYDGYEQPDQGAGESTGARIQRVAANAGFNLSTNIDTGAFTVQATNLSQNALTEAKLAADSDGGNLWADPDGTIVFEGQAALVTNTRSTTSQVTFGPGVGEVPFTDAVPTNDSDLIYNIVAYARANGTTQVAADATSRSLYGDRSKSRTDLICETDGQVAQLASFDLQRFKDAEYRVASLTLKPMKNGSLMWPHVLGRRIHDKAVVKVPTPSGQTIQRDVFFEGVSHRITPKDWTTEFRFSSATVYTAGVTAAALQFSVQPPPLTNAGSPFSTTVRVVDSLSQTVTSSSAPVTLAIGNDPTNATGLVTTLQAEDATLTGTAAPPTGFNVYALNGGYNGSGYVGEWNANGQYVAFSYTATVTTTATLSFRYANNIGATAIRRLYIDGVSTANLSFPVTGGWDIHSVVSTTLAVVAGTTYTVQLRFESGSGSVNYMDLDQLAISIPNPAVLSRTSTSYQAEDAVLAGEGTGGSGGYTFGIHTYNSGWTGTGHVGQWNINGQSVTFSVTPPGAGLYNLTLRYANGPQPTDLTAHRRIKVNGATLVSAQTFLPTLSWDAYTTVDVPATLTSGVNTILIEFDSGSGSDNFIDLDSLALPASLTVTAVNGVATFSDLRIDKSNSTGGVGQVFGPETFTGTNGSALPSPWQVTTITPSEDTAGTSSSAAIQGNVARLSVTLDSASDDRRVYAIYPAPMYNQRVTGRVRFDGISANCHGSIYVRRTGDHNQGNDAVNGPYGYSLSIQPDNALVAIGKRAPGYTQVGTAAFTSAVNTWYNFRVEVEGSTIRVWMGTGTFADVWLLTGTDTAVTTPGNCQIWNHWGPSSGAGTIYYEYDDIVIEEITQASGAPPAGYYTLAATSPGLTSATSNNFSIGGTGSGSGGGGGGATPPPPTGAKWIGMNAVFNGTLADLAAAHQVNSLRVEFPYWPAYTQNGGWTNNHFYEVADGDIAAIFNYAAARGQSVLPICSVGGPGAMPSTTGSTTQAVANAVAGFAQRFCAGGTFWAGRSDAALAPTVVELLNEPYFSGLPAEYLDLMQKSRAALNSAGKTTIGLLGAYADNTSTAWNNWNNTLAASYPTYCTGITVHAYGDYATPYTSGNFGVHAVYRAHADVPSLPIWITEVGWGVTGAPAGGAVTVANKSLYIRNLIDDVQAQSWLRGFHYYQIQNEAEADYAPYWGDWVTALVS